MYSLTVCNSKHKGFLKKNEAADFNLINLKNNNKIKYLSINIILVLFVMMHLKGNRD